VIVRIRANGRAQTMGWLRAAIAAALVMGWVACGGSDKPPAGDRDAGSDAGDPANPGAISEATRACLEQHGISLVPASSPRAMAQLVAVIQARCQPEDDDLGAIGAELGADL